MKSDRSVIFEKTDWPDWHFVFEQKSIQSGQWALATSTSKCYQSSSDSDSDPSLCFSFRTPLVTEFTVYYGLVHRSELNSRCFPTENIETPWIQLRAVYSGWNRGSDLNLNVRLSGYTPLSFHKRHTPKVVVWFTHFLNTWNLMKIPSLVFLFVLLLCNQ